MTLREWNKYNRYQLRKAVYRSRAHIGWVVIALICFALWFVNHENLRLEGENRELRARYTETHDRLTVANQANEVALARYQALRDRQLDIINLLKGGDCASQQQGHRPD